MSLIADTAPAVAAEPRVRRAVAVRVRWRPSLPLAVTAVSALLWLGWQLVRPFPHPWGDLSRGTYTDHFSHMNNARIFPRAGLNLWRRPIASMFRRLTDEEMKRLPDDVRVGASWSGGVFSVRRWPADKPLAASWSNLPHLYPPGDLLLVAPVAILYHNTTLTLVHANRLLLVLFLVYAHVALYFFFKRVLAGHPSQAAGAFLALFIVYAEVIHWTLEGFYDAVTIAPLLLCASYLDRRRGLAALVAYSVAISLHYRAFFLAPWGVYALVILVRDREWIVWTRRHWMALAAGGVLAALSIGTFVLVSPWFDQIPLTNPVALATNRLSSPLSLAFVCVIVIAAGAFVAARAWLDLAVVGWMTLMIFTMKFIYPWYILVPLAWLGAPRFSDNEKRSAVAADTRAIVLLTTGVLVFNSPMVPIWLTQLFR